MSRSVQAIHIAVVGVTHADADLPTREAVARGARPAAVTTALGPETECIVLATCDRHEVIVAAAHAGVGADAHAAMAHLTGVDPARFTVRRGRLAVRHVMRVAMGLDAAIVGEHEVQGQLGHAWRQARHAGACGTVLGRLVQEALHTAGRARSQTGLGRGRTSLASLAVGEAGRRLGGLDGRDALVVGADPVARAVARRLVDATGGRTWVAGPEGASRRLAADAGARHLVDTAGGRAPVVDVVVACSPPAEGLLKALQAGLLRPGGVVVDLGMPRALTGVAAPSADVDLDTLRQAAADGEGLRARDAAAAERIASEGTAAMMEWLSGRPAAPAVRALMAHAEAVRDEEVRRALRGVTDPAQRAALERLGRRLTGALMHAPVTGLRRSPTPDADMRVLGRLLGREPPAM